MKQRPLPGDVVCLNDHGLRGGLKLDSREAIRQSMRMMITYVGENLTNDVPSYLIEVDAPLINRFMLTNHDVDLIERPPVPLPNKAQPKVYNLDDPSDFAEAERLGMVRVEHDPRGFRTLIIGGGR